MFRNYILATELSAQAKFNISNVSMAIHPSQGVIEGLDFYKFGSITLLSKQSKNLPSYIQNHINEQLDNLTDLKGLYPKRYLEEVLGGAKNTKLVCDVIEIEKKNS